MRKIVLATVAAATLGLSGSAALAAEDRDRQEQYNFIAQNADGRSGLTRYFTSGVLASERARDTDVRPLSTNLRDRNEREKVRRMDRIR